jgi:hypothetical protein
LESKEKGEHFSAQQHPHPIASRNNNNNDNDDSHRFALESCCTVGRAAGCVYTVEQLCPQPQSTIIVYFYRIEFIEL